MQLYSNDEESNAADDDATIERSEDEIEKRKTKTKR
jgi:hypothetical protein